MGRSRSSLLDWGIALSADIMRSVAIRRTIAEISKGARSQSKDWVVVDAVVVHIGAPAEKTSGEKLTGRKIQQQAPHFVLTTIILPRSHDRL